ncbi:hypothetical protein SEUCBS139899_005993 [Sporothrix eucalyptigena]|uniref:Zn(2)-C6 fungal-type domain-containing protein n=1 Tax=Sporothrix eucalyptigena TaxID=1812306 RepID=A0ABP0D2I9_9PEZI
MSTLLKSVPPPKQIRFVNNQGQPPSKRRRVNAACLTCRKRKTRCAGERPTCSTCATNGHDCLGYTDIAEKRKDFAANAGTSSSGTASRERSVATDMKSEYDDDDDPNELPDDRQGATPNFISASDASTGRFDADDGDIISDGEIYDQPGTKCQRKSTGTSSNVHSQSQAHHSGEWSHSAQQQYQSYHSQHSEQQQPQPQSQSQTNASNQHPQLNRRSVSFHEGSQGSNTRQSPSQHQQHQHQHHNESHRVPYFRYFGPTAIVPGYKQMVVDVSVRDRRRSRGSSFSTSSPSTAFTDGGNYHRGQQGHARQSNFDPVFESLEDLPIYDPNDPAPVHPLIINLIKTFFVHLGCNYPFLREDRMLRMVREKRVEAILVDAMCALAARFSDLPVFANGSEGESGINNDSNNGGANDGISRSENGSVYAQRAKAATVDTFPCPTVAAVQACLLMAYEGFGADQDSALWMYLGLAIRMAVDLGLQKKLSVAPQPDKARWFMRFWDGKRNGDSEGDDGEDSNDNAVVDNNASSKISGRNSTSGMQDVEGPLSAEELHAVEQERDDTFWAVFFLDRVISSGTGRPVTFRDDDFELALPEPMLDPLTGWPAPFPILVQIIHLYGRVSDVLNNIHSADDLSQEKMQRLGRMENDLTQLYQRQDPRLNFNATNFQAYVRAGQGTTFTLVHCWFHTLIIILHQPTLLVPFGGLRRMHQLLPNSHELSMSSAKTIADILAFAELIDPKSFIGNPFTSQPIYIAACAFLMESAANASLPASRDTTPPPPDSHSRGTGSTGSDSRAGASSSKHSLLASNANQNYQRCYKSLQQLHTYWGGVRYILSALDQKSKGIWDCETFTSEEMGSTKQPMRRGSLSQMPRLDNPSSPNAPPIAWSLTGTSNSANPSLTVLFQSHQGNTGSIASGLKPQDATSRQQDRQKHRKQSALQARQTRPTVQNQYGSPQLASAATPPGNMIYDPIRQSLPEVPTMYPPAYPQANVSAVRYSGHQQQQQQQHQYQQQHGSHPPPPPFSENSLPAHDQDRNMYKYEQMQQGDMDSTSPASAPNVQQGIYGNSNNIAYTGQQQHQVQHQMQHGQQQYNHQHQHGQDQHVHHQDFMHQSHHQTQQSLPAPVQSYNTPSSHHSSGYDGAVLPGTSPSNNGLANFDQGNASASGNSPRAAAALGHLDGNGMYQSDFGQGSNLMGGPYSYLEAGPITDVVTFDSQEIDIASLVLPPELMPLWLEYVPTNVLNLFDDGTNRSNQ